MIDSYGNFISWVPKLVASGKPLYLALAECIEADIRKGTLESGFRMPPQRILANYININHSTVTHAYRLCEERGLLKGIVGKGTFVSIYAQVPQSIIGDYNKENLIDFGMLRPLSETSKELEGLLAEIYTGIDYPRVLEYAPPEGLPHQRYIFSKWLNSLQLKCTPAQIIIAAGVQNALSVILSAMFQRGDRILVDELTYTGFSNISKVLGLLLIPITSGEDGIDVDQLISACKREAPKGIYLIPDVHNPTSVILSLEKRKQIAEVIIKYNLILLEDDPYGRLTYNQVPPITNFAVDNSFFITGTSKSISPAFRIAIIYSPLRYVSQVTNMLNIIAWSASTINAEIISQLISSYKYQDILTLKKDILARRNGIIDEVLSQYCLLPARVSFLRYLILPEHNQSEDIELRCLKNGLQVFSSKRFSVGINQHDSAIRLSVSGPRSETELIKGLHQLRKTINEISFH